MVRSRNGHRKLFTWYQAIKSFFILQITVSLFFLHPGILLASSVSAKAAVLMDGNSEKILYAKNPSLKLPPASTTKLVTAMVVLEKLDTERMVTISARAAKTPSVKPHFKAGQKIKVIDLLYIALMKSVNGAAVALAEAAAGSEHDFVSLMNEKVRSLGIANTRFVNASGLPGKGQYTTAHDIAKVLKQALTYPLIAEIVGTRVKMIRVNNRPVLIKNTNVLLWMDDNQIGGKTGYTRAAKHCVVAATKRGYRTLIVALLGETVRNNLWLDARNLLES